MAKHTVTHTCGHDETHQLYGPTRDRAYREQRLAERPCSACQDAEWHRWRSHENAASALLAEVDQLPALTGSEKQIAWAETIRRTALINLVALRAEWEQGIERMIKNGQIDPVAMDAADEAIGAYRTELLAQTRAGWWIDERHRLTERHRMLSFVGPRVRDAVLPHRR